MKTIKLTLITILAATVLAACGSDKKSGGTARTGNGTIPGLSCTGCSTSNLLYRSLGRTGNGVDLIMEFYAADYNDVNGTYVGGEYSGSVDGIGILSVATGLSCSDTGTGVPLPRGNYAVQVLDGGFGYLDPNSMLMYGTQVVARGGSYEVYLEQENSVFYPASPMMRGCDGKDYGTEMIGQWRVTGIRYGSKNYTCNKLVYFDTKQWGYENQGGQLLCP